MRWRLGGAALLAATALACGAAEPAAPPLRVWVGPSGTATVAVAWRGVQVSADGRDAQGLERRWAQPLAPAAGQPVAFTVYAASADADRAIRVTGAVTDYRGTNLLAVDFALPVKAGTTNGQTVSVMPSATTPGPFLFSATWTESGGAARGALACAEGLANARLVVEDFELVRYAVPGASQEIGAAAARQGRMGLIVRPQPEDRKGRPRGPEEGLMVRHGVPLDLELPGRPTRVGIWVKASAPTRLALRLRDPGVEVRQAVTPDKWMIGPREAAAGDWQWLEFPAPGYGRPRALVRSSCEADGVVDYPLTLETLDLECPSNTVVMLDELAVWTQTEPEQAMRVRAVLAKPAGLLYRTDTLRLALANGWLWGAAREFGYAAALQDIAGRERPLCAGTVRIEPGAEALVDARLVDLPEGAYRLNAQLTSGGRTNASVAGAPPLAVWEPRGKPLGHEALNGLLAGRFDVLAALGLTNDVVLYPWQSVDGGIAVEYPQGYFNFSWIDPEVDLRRAAGVSVLGRLGFTTPWADPNGNYDTKSSCWIGNVYTLPSQPIYWEEYVYRTVAHCRGRIDTWVVWDRPDADGFGATSAEFTERLLAVSARAARRANPGVRLVSGGVIRENIEKTFKGLIDARAGRYIDAVGILPSTAPLSPEEGHLDVILSRVQRLKAREKFEPAVWAFGLGWRTGEGEGCVDEFEQARYVARGHALCRAFGVERVLHEPYEVWRRDGTGYVFLEGGYHGLKPAALAARTAAALLDDAQPVREAFLLDRRDGLARSFLFRKPDGRLLLAAWRVDGTSRLTLPAGVESVSDVFGNRAVPAGAAAELDLDGAPRYVVFAPEDPEALLRKIERAPVAYDDAPESAWKRGWTFFLDVGNPDEEKAAQYGVTQGRVVGPVASHYHNDYGRSVVDSGRHFRGEESFAVDVSSYGAADMILRKRINYSVLNQLVDVSCNGQTVGPWFAFKRDRRFVWRDVEFVVPNRFFAGQKSAVLRFAAESNTVATTYAVWAGPLGGKTVYVSDLSLLVSTSGYGPGVNRDRNILGGLMQFFKGDGRVHAKGLGTNSAESMDDSLVVLMLNKQYKRLRGVVGVDRAANGRGSVRFRVSDGRRPVFDSRDMTYFSEPMPFDVDVSDAILVLLSTEDGGDGRQNDIANWADLQLERK